MEVCLKPEVKEKLSKMAAQQGRDAAALVEEAVEQLVEYDEWFSREVDKGLVVADRDEFVEHDAVRALIDRDYPG